MHRRDEPGVLDDVTQSFTVTVSSPGGSGTATFTPTSPNGGTISGESSVQGGTIATTGDYHLTKNGDVYEGDATITSCGNFGGVKTCSNAGKFHFTLTPET